MIYRAFLGKEEINEFSLDGQSIDEIRGGKEIFWRKQKGKPGIRVPARYFETKLLCETGASVGYFTNYSEKQGTGYQKSLEIVKPDKPYISQIYTWGTHEKADEQGEESDYTRYVLSNESGGKIYVMDFTWYKPKDSTSDCIAYFNKFMIIEDGEIKDSYTGTKLYFPIKSITGVAHAEPAYFFSKDGDFHFYVVWTQQVDTSSGEKETWSDYATHYVFRKGVVAGKKEFIPYRNAFSFRLSNSPELRATNTIEINGKVYLSILTGDFETQGIYQIEAIDTGSTDMEILDGNFPVGKFEGRQFVSDTYGNKLYEYSGNGTDTLKCTTTSEIAGTFRPWRFSLYNNAIYVANNKNVYSVGDVDQNPSSAKIIYTPEFKSGSEPVIRGITVEKDTLFVFYQKGKKYYMDAVALKEL